MYPTLTAATNEYLTDSMNIWNLSSGTVIVHSCLASPITRVHEYINLQLQSKERTRMKDFTDIK